MEKNNQRRRGRNKHPWLALKTHPDQTNGRRIQENNTYAYFVGISTEK